MTNLQKIRDRKTEDRKGKKEEGREGANINGGKKKDRWC